MKAPLDGVDAELVMRRITSEERQCRMKGRIGIVERVYRARGRQWAKPAQLRAKVLMDHGPVIYVPLAECAMF